MSIPLGDVALSKVLQDLDMAGAHGLSERPVQNRAGKDSGASLASLSGIAASPQIEFGTNSWNPNWSGLIKRSAGYKRAFPDDTMPGLGEVYLTTAADGPLVTSKAIPLWYQGACSTEFVTPFRVSESGNYRLTGTVETSEKIQGGGYASQWQVAVATYQTGYFAGNSNLDFNEISYDQGTFNIDATLPLSSARRFGCLIFYAIGVGPHSGTGIGVDGAAREARYKNFMLRQV